MGSLKRGLGKSFDRIFGEGKGNIDSNEVSEENKNEEQEVKVVEKVVEKIVEVPVEKVVEKIVEVPANEVAAGEPLLVNINFVQANPNQPRKVFDEEKLKELAGSIANYGIIEPIVVRKTGPVHYEVIAGERRLRAAKLAGLEKVPVIVKEYDDQERKEIAIIENVQREDLNAVEKAEGYKALIDEYHLTQDDLAIKVGKSRAAVANTLRILQLDERLRQMIKDGILSEGHARTLLSIDEKELRDKLVEKTINEKLSVRKLEDLIRAEKLAIARKEKEQENNTEYFKLIKIQIKDIEKQMKGKLNAALRIAPKNEQSGVIEIKYDTAEELDRIYLLINSINP